MFGDRDTVQPHKGEVIAAFYAPEECWYRGLVLDTMEDKIKVCVNQSCLCSCLA